MGGRAGSRLASLISPRRVDASDGARDVLWGAAGLDHAQPDSIDSVLDAIELVVII